MGRVGKIARRTFLIGSAAVLGGVSFGVYKMLEAAPNPLGATETEISLNAFVVIAESGIKLVVPKAEMGQGVQTTWAALIAEELDVEFDQIEVIHGPPAQAYYNSALFGLALPFTDYKVSSFQQAVREFAGNGAKLLSLQLTGGSTSMKDAYERMRYVGATARETLKEAAAKEWGLRARDLTTARGEVIAPDGTALSYQALASAAAEISPPRVKLRDPSEWRFLGKSQPRVDMLPKVTGQAQFGIDLRLEGMKFASLRMSPNRQGMISFDATAAEAMPGVEQIIDMGEGVAVVAANTWAAIQAVEAIEIEWAPSLYPDTQEGLMAEIAASFEAEPNTVGRDDGDVEDVSGGTVIDVEYSVPYLAHAMLEPMSATALLDGDQLTVWSGNQAPGSMQSACAEEAGLPVENVTLHSLIMGGGSGRRGETDFSVLATRVAKAMPGVPVQLTYSREEDMRRDFYRPAALARMRGVVDGGEALAVDVAYAAPSVISQTRARDGVAPMTAEQAIVEGSDAEALSGAWDQPYGIPNYRVRGHVTNSAMPIGYWRSVGASYGGYFFDSLLDEMAYEAGRDPLEFRLDLARREHEPSALVFEAVRDMSGWDAGRPEGTALGVGFTYSFGSPVAQVIEVEDTGSGIRMNKVWIAADVGTALDPSIIEAQLFGGCLFGLSAAMMGENTFSDGGIEQLNFWDYDSLRMYNSPAFEVQILENAKYIGGVGEIATPPAPAALGNALFALTGTRARSLPLNRHFDFI